MRPQMKEIGATFIVLEALSAAEVTKDGHRVLQVLVADESGSIALSLWDSYLEIAQPGSILALSRGYCTLFKGSAILYVGKHGTLQRVGEYVRRPCAGAARACASLLPLLFPFSTRAVLT